MFHTSFPRHQFITSANTFRPHAPAFIESLAPVLLLYFYVFVLLIRSGAWRWPYTDAFTSPAGSSPIYAHIHTHTRRVTSRRSGISARATSSGMRFAGARTCELCKRINCRRDGIPGIISAHAYWPRRNSRRRRRRCPGDCVRLSTWETSRNRRITRATYTHV